MIPRAKTAKRPAAFADSGQQLTFLEHVHELRNRLFWIGTWFVVASGAVYPLFDHVVRLLTAPLEGRELYYLTPAGGLSFIIKICMYIGFILVMPVVIYHLFQFVAPVMKATQRRAVVMYTCASALLALIGVLFAYYATLPAAIYFLTSINIDQISSLLTVDSYLSFVFAYLLAGALLFQIPLILLVINSATPLKPSRLMQYHRHVIVTSFILAALITPTPDVVNQTIMALPIILMYQIGITMVWLKNRRRDVTTDILSVATTVTPAREHVVSIPRVATRAHQSRAHHYPRGAIADVSSVSHLSSPPQHMKPAATATLAGQVRSVDGFRPVGHSADALPRMRAPARMAVQYRRPVLKPVRTLIPTI